MSKRTTNAEVTLIAWVIVIGTPIYLVSKAGESIGWAPLVVTAVIGIALYVWYSTAKTKKRRASLLEKYNDSSVVEDIMARSVWVDQTSEQLLDSLGEPVDIDEKVLKTKKKEIWKYTHKGGNRYGLRITLDNDIVVGWEDKR